VQITYPALDGDCLIKILRGEQYPVVIPDGSPFAYLMRGDLLPWEISKTRKFYGPELQPMFESIGLKIELLQTYRDKYCADPGKAPDSVLN
jgi:hypothetical protein